MAKITVITNSRLVREGPEMEEALAALQGDPMPDPQNTFTSTGNDPGEIEEGGYELHEVSIPNASASTHAVPAAEQAGALTHELLLEAYRLLDEVDARAAPRIRYQYYWGRSMGWLFSEAWVPMSILCVGQSASSHEEVANNAIGMAHPIAEAEAVKDDPYENESFAEWQKRSLEDIRAKRAAHG